MQQLNRVDRYELVTVLGHGATGIVYLGRDTKLDREVAVKVMNPEVAGNAAARSLFHREAKAIARLTHPNIIALHDYSGPDSETIYLVVERLRGKNLLDVAKKRPLTAVAAAAAAHEICMALGHAHDQGIIHRDLKPENIFLEPDGRVVLCDFGIARDYRSSMQHTLASRHTQLAGSPMYMSPEQVLTPQAVGPSSDLFSLGSILYFLVTGQHAFAGASMHKVLKNVSEVKVASLHKQGVPAGYADIVHKLLQRDPERRYGSARQLGQDLHAFLQASSERDPRSVLMLLAEQAAKSDPVASTLPDVAAAVESPNKTMIMLVKKRADEIEGQADDGEPILLTPVGPAPSAAVVPAVPMDPEDTASDPPRKEIRTGVLLWSVIAAITIMLAGLAVAELDALAGFRAWLQSLAK